jgi:hypothetical protein
MSTAGKFIFNLAAFGNSSGQFRNELQMVEVYCERAGAEHKNAK